MGLAYVLCDFRVFVCVFFYVFFRVRYVFFYVRYVFGDVRAPSGSSRRTSVPES